MKRLILCIERAKGKKLQTRVVALPAEWTLRQLHGTITAAFSEFYGSTVIAYADLVRQRGCGGSLTPDPRSDWEEGMSLEETLGKVFAKKGDLLVCRCSREFGEGEADFAVEFLRADEGEWPECLAADGPNSGPHKPDMVLINTRLQEIRDGSGGADGDASRAEGLFGSVRTGMSLEPRCELLWQPPERPAAEEEVTLDDSPVAPALYRRACELARRVWDLAPWEQLEEIQPVVLRLSGGRERILSVLGSMGEYRALAFYPDLSVFNVFQSIVPAHAPFGLNHFFAFRHWQVAFLKTPELLPGEAAAVKASGVKFARGALPSFESFAPGFMPWRAGGREMGDMVELLEAAVALFGDPRAMGELADLVNVPGEVHVWERGAGGAWQLSPSTRPMALRWSLDLPPDLLERIRALPVKEGLAAFGDLIMPVGKKTERGMAARVVLCVDERTGFVATSMASEDGGTPRLSRPSDLLEKVAEALLKMPYGFFPSRLASPCDFMAIFLRRLAELRGGGVRFDAEEACPALLACHADFERMLGRCGGGGRARTVRQGRPARRSGPEQNP